MIIRYCLDCRKQCYGKYCQKCYITKHNPVKKGRIVTWGYKTSQTILNNPKLIKIRKINGRKNGLKNKGMKQLLSQRKKIKDIMLNKWKNICIEVSQKDFRVNVQKIKPKDYEKQRISHFSKNSWKCMILWNDELSNPNILKNKIERCLLS